MKISTSLLFERAATRMSEVQSRVVKSQAQVASGKQVMRPSDSPEQAATIQRYKSLLARQENHLANIGLVTVRLQGEAAAIESSVTLMHRIKELTIQAANGTLSPSDRQSVATELRGIRDQLLSLANSQDTTGNYIFSGSRVGMPAFAPARDDPTGPPAYQGDRTRMGVTIGDQRQLPMNRAGADVFTRVVREDGEGGAGGVGFFKALDDLVTAVQTSDIPKIQRGISETDAMLDGLLGALADVGTDMNMLDQQTATLEDLRVVIKANLSDVEDLDYPTAITLMNKQMLSLEAAQSSFAKISQLNLFNFLR